MKRRYEFRARLWQSIATVGICAGLTLATVGCGEVFHQPKHTGRVAIDDIIERGTYQTYQFVRPNREIFVMHFSANTGPMLHIGAELEDLLYEDDGKNDRIFVKAILAKPPLETSAPADKPTPIASADTVKGSEAILQGWSYRCVTIDGSTNTISGNRDCTNGYTP